MRHRGRSDTEEAHGAGRESAAAGKVADVRAGDDHLACVLVSRIGRLGDDADVVAAVRGREDDAGGLRDGLPRVGDPPWRTRDPGPLFWVSTPDLRWGFSTIKLCPPARRDGPGSEGKIHRVDPKFAS